MNLFRSERGDTHMLVMFVALFAVIGVIGVVVSQAASGVIGVKGVVVKTSSSKTNPDEKETAYANAKGTISKVRDCINRRLPIIGCKPGTSRVTSFTTDKNGEFTKKVGPGQYQVSIDKPGAQDPDCSIQTVNVARTEHAEVKIICTEGPAVVGDPMGIKGEVLVNKPCPAGQVCSAVMVPLANARGSITPTGTTPAAQKYSFTTDKDGKFTTNVGRGSYVVNVGPNTASAYPKCQEQQVEVSSFGYVDVAITCQNRNSQYLE